MKHRKRQWIIGLMIVFMALMPIQALSEDVPTAFGSVAEFFSRMKEIHFTFDSLKAFFEKLHEIPAEQDYVVCAYEGQDDAVEQLSDMASQGASELMDYGVMGLRTSDRIVFMWLNPGKRLPATYSQRPVVTIVSFEDAKVVMDTPVEIVVKTNAACNKLVMYAIEGGQIQKWDAETYSTVQRDVRTWTVKHTFPHAGTRAVIFKGAVDAQLSSGIKTVLTIAAVPVVKKIVGDRGVGTVQLTVTTNGVCDQLRMYDQEKQLLASWTAEDCSTLSGDVRTWQVAYTFDKPGVHHVTFKGVGGKAVSMGRTEYITSK